MNLVRADNGEANSPLSDSDAVRSARYAVEMDTKHTSTRIPIHPSQLYLPKRPIYTHPLPVSAATESILPLSSR